MEGGRRTRFIFIIRRAIFFGAQINRPSWRSSALIVEYTSMTNLCRLEFAIFVSFLRHCNPKNLLGNTVKELRRTLNGRIKETSFGPRSL